MSPASPRTYALPTSVALALVCATLLWSLARSAGPVPLRLVGGFFLGLLLAMVFAFLHRRRDGHDIDAYAPLLDNPHLGVVISRQADGVLLHVSRSLIDRLGVPSSELVGHSAVERGFYPDEATRAAWVAGMKERGSSPLRDFAIPLPNGAQWQILVTAMLVAIDGVPCVLTLVVDATERARAIDELHRNEERLRLAMDASQEGFWDWNVGSDDLYVSPRCFHVLDEEPLAQPVPTAWWHDRVHPDDRSRVAAALAAIEAGSEQPMRLECRVRARDGEHRWLLARARVAARDATGRPLRVLGTLVDISARREAEIERAASERRFRTLLEASPDLVFLLDREERVVYANEAAARALDVPAASLVGRPQSDLFPAETARAHSRALAHVISTGERSRSEAPHTMGGRTVWIETALSPLRDEEGRVVSVLGVSRDITARRAAEHALRRAFQLTTDILESTSDGFMTLDDSLVVGTFNRAAERLLGRRRDEVLKQRLFDALPELRGSEIERRCNEALRTRTPDAFELHLTAEPYANWYDVRLLPLQEGLSVFFRVTTDRKRLEAQLAQAQKMEAMGRLAGGVAHDFNNQLAAILGYDELLLRDLEPGHPARSRAEQIRRAAERAAALTRQLLAFGRKQVLEPRRLNLNVVVAELEEMLRRTIGEDVEMIVTLAPDLHSVRADRSQIEQALLNLVVNARDAMPGGGQLTIETRNATLDAEQARGRADASPGAYVELSVRDTGMGMDGAVQARLFEPFFTTKDFGKGTGLGLSIVYGFVRQSGGHISVESQPGHGSRLAILLPRIEAVAPLHGAALRDAAPVRQTGTELVLVIEPEPSSRRLVVEVLRASGYTVLEAATQQEAAANVALGDDSISLVIASAESGASSATPLLTPATRARLLVLTSEQTAERAGADPRVSAVLRKPFSPTTLVRKVREVLDAPPAS